MLPQVINADEDAHIVWPGLPELCGKPAQQVRGAVPGPAAVFDLPGAGRSIFPVLFKAETILEEPAPLETPTLTGRSIFSFTSAPIFSHSTAFFNKSPSVPIGSLFTVLEFPLD